MQSSCYSDTPHTCSPSKLTSNAFSPPSPFFNLCSALPLVVPDITTRLRRHFQPFIITPPSFHPFPHLRPLLHPSPSPCKPSSYPSPSFRAVPSAVPSSPWLLRSWPRTANARPPPGARRRPRPPPTPAPATCAFILHLQNGSDVHGVASPCRPPGLEFSFPRLWPSLRMSLAGPSPQSEPSPPPGCESPWAGARLFSGPSCCTPPPQASLPPARRSLLSINKTAC